MMNRFRIVFASCVALLGVSCSRSIDTASVRRSISFTVDASSLDLRTKAEYAGEPLVLTAATGDSLYLHPSVEDLGAAAVTRGALVGSATAFHSDFRVHAYMPDGVCYIDGSKVDQYSGTTWSESAGSHMWPDDNKLSFYASAPYTLTGISAFKADEVEGKITFSYDTPRGSAGNDAQLQPDLAFAYTACSKEDADGVASLHFSHALSAVGFVAKDIAGCTIKSISIENVYSSGDCEAIPASKSYDWTVGSTIGSYTQKFDVALADSQTGEQPITSEDKYFMLVPQSVPDGAQIRIVLETHDNNTLTLTGALVGQVWQPGKLYTYSISTDSINWTYVFEVTESINLPNGTTASDYNVSSYRYRTQNPSVREPLAWSAKITDASQSDHVFDFTYSGAGSVSSTYPITLERTSVRTDWDNNEQHLKNATPKGTPENPYNLAMPDGTTATVSQMTTANCYIVNAPGTYAIPAIYGNAIKNLGYNEEAYKDKGFLNYKGAEIDDPYVSSGGTLGDAVLVWADAFYMFKDVKLDVEDQNIVFTIDPEFMQQANAIFAVRDTEGKIMWSWHVWVTEHDLEDTYSLYDYNSKTMYYEMMPISLGWIDGKRVWYDERNLSFEFTQAGTGKVCTMAVRQEGAEYQYTDVGSLYYQWGRKDPIIGLKSRALHGAEDYRPHEVVDEKYRYRYEEKYVDIATSIQNPNVYYVHKNGSTGNWLTSPVANLWDGNSSEASSSTSVKTIYDPCPRGFKIPTPQAFSVFVGGNTDTNTDASTLNGSQLANGYEYEVYTQPGKKGEKVKFIATGQRVDRIGSSLGEVGGLWAMQGVYFWTCYGGRSAMSYSMCIRIEPGDGNTAVTQTFAGASSMARPVRPIKE